jgi:hypothetical protein
MHEKVFDPLVKLVTLVPFGELIFMVSWLALAMLGGGLIVAVWEGLGRRDEDVNRP